MIIGRHFPDRNSSVVSAGQPRWSLVIEKSLRRGAWSRRSCPVVVSSRTVLVNTAYTILFAKRGATAGATRDGQSRKNHGRKGDDHEKTDGNPHGGPRPLGRRRLSGAFAVQLSPERGGGQPLPPFRLCGP